MLPRYNRPVDCGPKCDIHCCDVVGWASKPTRLTSKLISGKPISLGDMPARWTCSGCVPRIHKGNKNTCDLGFVVHERSEQSKIPSMQDATLCRSNRGSGSNALKIFKSNRSQSVFGFRNKLLGNPMVNVSGESSHSTRKLLQMAFGRFGSFALEPGFQRVKSISGLVDLLARMYLSIRINCKVFNAKINTKNTNWVIGGLFRDFNHGTKVENTIDQDQVCLASYPVHTGRLIFSHSNRDKLPALKSSKRYMLQALPRKDALIIDDRTIKPKFRFDGFVPLIGFANLGNGPNSKLRGESKMFSDRIVNRLMDFDLVGTMHSKNSLCYVITSLVKPLHCITEHLTLLSRGDKLNHQSLKHSTEESIQRLDRFWCIATAGYAPPRSEGLGLRYPCTPRFS